MRKILVVLWLLVFSAGANKTLAQGYGQSLYKKGISREILISELISGDCQSLIVPCSEFMLFVTLNDSTTLTSFIKYLKELKEDKCPSGQHAVPAAVQESRLLIFKSWSPARVTRVFNGNENCLFREEAGSSVMVLPLHPGIVRLTNARERDSQTNLRAATVDSITVRDTAKVVVPTVPKRISSASDSQFAPRVSQVGGQGQQGQGRGLPMWNGRLSHAEAVLWVREGCPKRAGFFATCTELWIQYLREDPNGAPKEKEVSGLAAYMANTLVDRECPTDGPMRLWWLDTSTPAGQLRLRGWGSEGNTRMANAGERCLFNPLTNRWVLSLWCGNAISSPQPEAPAQLFFVPQPVPEISRDAPRTYDVLVNFPDSVRIREAMLDSVITATLDTSYTGNVILRFRRDATMKAPPSVPVPDTVRIKERYIPWPWIIGSGVAIAAIAGILGHERGQKNIRIKPCPCSQNGLPVDPRPLISPTWKPSFQIQFPFFLRS